MIGIIERLISAKVCGAILLIFIIIFIIKNSKIAKITKNRLEAITIFIFITLILFVVFYYRGIMFLKVDKTTGELDVVPLLSLVIAIFTMYGIYLGFLQFIISYKNKEKDAYLGYNKIYFLASGSKWFQFTHSLVFLVLLLITIIVPVIYRYLLSFCDLLIYLWQGIVVGVVLVYIALFKFSLEVASKTLDINITKDERVKKDIEKNVEKEFTKIFDEMQKKGFSENLRKSFFNKFNKGLGNIEDKSERLKYFRIVFRSVFQNEFKKKPFENEEKKRIKEFFKEKYKLLSEESNFSESKFLEFVKEEYILDTNRFNKLIKEDSGWIKREYAPLKIYKSLASEIGSNKGKNRGGNYSKVSKLEIKQEQVLPKIDKEEDIHIYIFEKVESILNATNNIDYLIDIVQRIKSYDVFYEKCWKIEGEKKGIELNENDSSIIITKINFNDVKECIIRSTSSEKEYKKDIGKISFLTNSSIVEVKFVFNDKKECSIKKTNMREYFYDFEKKAWGKVLGGICSNYTLEEKIKRYKDSDEKFNSEVDRRCLSDKVYYSKMCFKYLIDNLTIQKKCDRNARLEIELVVAMTKVYRGAYSLYRLIGTGNENWNQRDEEFSDILKSVLPSKEKEKEVFYNEMISIINSETESKGKNIYEMLFEKRNENSINDEFMINFKTTNKLKLVIVKNILSDTNNAYININLSNEFMKQLVKQYIQGIANSKKMFSRNNSLDRMLSKNISLLESYELQDFSLITFILLEQHLDNGYFLEKKGENGESFMIKLISNEYKKEKWVEIFRWSNLLRKRDKPYIDYVFFTNSILQFFTLKIVSTKGSSYYNIWKNKKFQEKYLWEIKYYLMKNDLTLEQYLDEIQQSANERGIKQLGDREKIIIARKIKELDPEI